MESIKELKQICGKSGVQERWYIKHVIRNISIHFTRIFLRMPMRANHISMIMIAISIIAGIFLGLGGYINRLLGVFFLQFTLVLDAADGEVARYRKTKSKRGRFLDRLANTIILTSAFLGLTLGLFIKGDFLILPYQIKLIFGINAVIFPLLYVASNYYLNYAGATPEQLSTEIAKTKPAKLLKRFFLFWVDLLNIVNILTVAAIFNISSVALIIYGIIFFLWWLLSTISMYRKI